MIWSVFLVFTLSSVIEDRIHLYGSFKSICTEPVWPDQKSYQPPGHVQKVSYQNSS